jgi:hypothetical protein
MLNKKNRASAATAKVGPTKNHARIFILSCIDILLTVPLGIFFMRNNAQNVNPWLGWDDTHAKFSNIDQFPSIIWRSIPALELGLECTRWSPVLCAVVWFLFFGLDGQAREHYLLALGWVGDKTGFVRAVKWVYRRTGLKGVMRKWGWDKAPASEPPRVNVLDTAERKKPVDYLDQMDAEFAEWDKREKEEAERLAAQEKNNLSDVNSDNGLNRFDIDLEVGKSDLSLDTSSAEGSTTPIYNMYTSPFVRDTNGEGSGPSSAGTSTPASSYQDGSPSSGTEDATGGKRKNSDASAQEIHMPVFPECARLFGESGDKVYHRHTVAF